MLSGYAMAFYIGCSNNLFILFWFHWSHDKVGSSDESEFRPLSLSRLYEFHFIIFHFLNKSISCQSSIKVWLIILIKIYFNLLIRYEFIEDDSGLTGTGFLHNLLSSLFQCVISIYLSYFRILKLCNWLFISISHSKFDLFAWIQCIHSSVQSSRLKSWMWTRRYSWRLLLDWRHWFCVRIRYCANGCRS